MSLLMDALRKAELAKRQADAANQATATVPINKQPLGQSQEPSESSSATQIKTTNSERLSLEPLSLEPLPPSTSPPSATADASIAIPPSNPDATNKKAPTLTVEHLASLDDEFIDEIERSARKFSPNPSPAQASKSTASPLLTPLHMATPQTVSVATAQNLFTAKQSQPAASHNKNFAIAAGSLTTLAIIAIGTYFWWQLQPHPPAHLTQSSPAPALPLPTPPTVTSAVSPAPTFPLAAPTADADSPDFTAPSQNTDPRKAAQNPSSPPQKKPARTRYSSLVEEPLAVDSPIRLTRSPQSIDPTLLRGYEAFERSDLSTAQIEYSRALKADAYNTDALHGLAAIAQKQGHWNLAAGYYQKILEANPQDATAQAALINLRSQSEPAAAESRLKTITTTQPDLAAPSFSLGNLYARQGRWQEAQQAYFQAYNADPDNPDILYNLAISLEHLHQLPLATKYYERAIAAAQSQPASFNRPQAITRLQLLQEVNAQKAHP